MSQLVAEVAPMRSIFDVYFKNWRSAMSLAGQMAWSKRWTLSWPTLAVAYKELETMLIPNGVRMDR